MLKQINGRHDDYLVFATGERCEPRRVRLLLQPFGDEIEHYKIEQHKIGYVVVKLVPARSDDHSQLRDRVAYSYASRFGELLTADVRIVDEIPPDPSGKRRSVVCCL